MNATLAPFFEYINGLDEDRRIHEPGFVVAEAYHEAQDSLIELKQSAQSYLVPGKNSRGQWIPVFDEDRTDDIAHLASRISETKAKIESICNDIETIMSIGDGPAVGPLLAKLQEATRSLRNAQNHAATMSQRAITKNPGMALEKISNLPGVAEAYLDLSEVEATAPAIIAELGERVSRRREIYAKYEA